MPVFQRKTFRPSSSQNTIAATYRRHLARHPFLLFGLPFITTMVAGSFFLTPATALRYERHDRKMRRLSEEEKMGLKQDLEGGAKGRKVRDVDAAEEYYRLSAKDLDDWENKRVERFKGEPDGAFRVGKKVGCCRSERSAERDSASIIGSRWIRALGKEKDSSVALVKVTDPTASGISQP